MAQTNDLNSAPSRPEAGRDDAELMLGVYDKVVAASSRPYQIMREDFP